MDIYAESCAGWRLMDIWLGSLTIPAGLHTSGHFAVDRVSTGPKFDGGWRDFDKFLSRAVYLVKSTLVLQEMGLRRYFTYISMYVKIYRSLNIFDKRARTFYVDLRTRT